MNEIETLKARLAELEKSAQPAPAAAPAALRVDLGCGPNPREGFIGVDRLKFDKVDVVLDIGRHTWPWADGSVEEAHSSHVLEHLEWPERVHFFNELYRVLKPGAKATIVVPHWCSARYYGDPTHKAPFSEWGWHYLSRQWRKGNAPHVDSEIAPGPLSYSCDFEYAYGYSLAPWMMGRSQEFQQFAFSAYKEAAQDMIGTLTKPKSNS